MIGSGSFSNVYGAYRNSDGIHVALKVKFFNK